MFNSINHVFITSFYFLIQNLVNYYYTVCDLTEPLNSGLKFLTPDFSRNFFLNIE
jgi:hypothetical protein